jgi:ketosteroid isomerase-like protein
MKRSIAIFLLAGLVVAAYVPRANAQTGDKAAIAALEQRIAKAVEAKDAKAILANYQAGNSLLVFDVLPPRQYSGWGAYLKDWQDALAGCADAPKMQISDLVTQVEGPFAYSHSLQHFVCTDPKGNKLDLTWRTTDVYRKSGGKWLVVHEHNSFPVDLTTAKADLNSKL